MKYEHITFDLSPKTIVILTPYLDKAFEEEIEDDHTMLEIENLANEFRARIQHVVAGA